METLAIKGHATRGKEVIEILEMLGGKNIFHRTGTEYGLVYYINDKNNIFQMQINDYNPCSNYTIFTLEEFLEKFPYKVGDEVIAYAEGCLAKFTIQDIRWNYELNKVEYKICSSWLDASLIMQPYKEEGVNLQELERKLDEALEKETKESLEEFFFGDPEPEPKAPILSNRYDYAEGKCGYVIPDGYEFDYIKEGFQTEIILKPKKPTYPKDYKECCKILNIPFDGNIVYAGHWVYGGEIFRKTFRRTPKVSKTPYLP